VSDGWQFVVAAYAITWTVLVGYAIYVARGWRRARRDADGGSL